VKQKIKRQDFWSVHIKSWKSSGQSQSEYCRRNNLDINLFSKWKHRNVNAGFIEVKAKVPKHIDYYDFIEISVHDDYKIKIKPNFDEETLRRVLSLLGGLR